MEASIAVEQALRIEEVCRRVGMSRAWIYSQVAAGRFPRPFKLGVRASAWRASDIDQYIADRAAGRDFPGRDRGGIGRAS
jgi:prophage regulatory protein